MHVLALAGGVGGAKLAAGLSHLLGERLTVLVNTGDDFEHLGLHVSPDIDTVIYTLAGIANPELGWGIAGETWACMEQVERLGGATWFGLGDRDIATHLLRTERLRRGDSLTEITRDLSIALGVRSHVLPMTDDRVRTRVQSNADTYDFQDYFVRLKCAVPVTRLSFDDAASAHFNEALNDLEREGTPLTVIICPSNPYLSIDPILALPGLVDWLKRKAAATIAVSPIVGDAAIKGPAAKIMQELGIKPTAAAVAVHYRDVIDGFIFDQRDANLAGQIAALEIEPLAAQQSCRARKIASPWQKSASILQAG